MNFAPTPSRVTASTAPLAFAVLSVWLGQRAGASLDFTLLRGVFIFIIFIGLAFGAEAVLTLQRAASAPAPRRAATLNASLSRGTGAQMTNDKREYSYGRRQ